MNQDKEKILEREDITIPSRMIQQSEFSDYRGGSDSQSECGLKELYMPSEEGLIDRSSNICERDFEVINKPGGFLYVPPYSQFKIGLEVTPTNNTTYNIVVKRMVMNSIGLIIL